MPALLSPLTAARPARKLSARSPLRFWELYRQRRQLADLDAHLLRDLGIAPDDRRAEARRPVWDAPAHWMS